MPEIGKQEWDLLQVALKAMTNAHALWGLKVGAAVLAKDWEIYNGCNVESWVSGLGICAERCAIDHAGLHSNKKIQKIALVMSADKQGQPKQYGPCLQYIHDFAKNAKQKVIMSQAKKR